MLNLDKLKGALRSLTVWFNGVAMAALAGLPMLQDMLPQLQPYVPPGIYQHGMLVVIVGNILLRFRTSTPLDQKGK
jgi:hypothetical protein